MLKGIVLAGGSGSRLYPITTAVSKQLLPIYDKPMIYYPLSLLMLGGIRQILVISTQQDIPRFEKLLGDGRQWGIHLAYAVQEKPEGIAQAFILAEDFIGKSGCTLVLGDNLFYGNDLINQLKKALQKKKGATVFAYKVSTPERYGIVEFDKEGAPLNIVEKPKKPRSSHAVTGLYVYDNHVIEIAKGLHPSARNELEITDINAHYLARKELDVVRMGRGMAWFDTGTFESLMDASLFIQTLQKRQGIKIACLEEIAYHQGYITAADLRRIAGMNPEYGKYLLEVVAEGSEGV